MADVGGDGGIGTNKQARHQAAGDIASGIEADSEHDPEAERLIRLLDEL